MDVAGWLRGLGLGQYEANFRDNKIDAEVLPQLTANDLKDIGVTAVGDRRRLLAAIAALAPPAPIRQREAGERPSQAEQGRDHAQRGGGDAAPRRDFAERRPITVMFCDLVGSTSLAARLDAEDWRNLVGAYFDEASAAVTGLGGHGHCGGEPRTRSARDLKQIDLLSRSRAKAEHRSGVRVKAIVIQEAGLDGFWIHRLLIAKGIESHVVDAASIAFPRRHRRAKTDAIDGETLLRTLMAWARGERRVRCSGTTRRRQRILARPRSAPR